MAVCVVYAAQTKSEWKDANQRKSSLSFQLQSWTVWRIKLELRVEFQLEVKAA